MKFIKPREEKVHVGNRVFENSTINLDLCESFKKMVTVNYADTVNAPSIRFQFANNNEQIWNFSTEKERDETYEILLIEAGI